MEPITTILASGPNWTLRRDGDGPAVLELRDVQGFYGGHAEGRMLVELRAPPDLAARIVGTPTHSDAEHFYHA